MLQSLRESLGAGVENAMVALSDVMGGVVIVAILFIIYWAVDKRTGQFVLLAFSTGNFVNQFVKNLVCAYRPWIRDPRIVPATGAIEGATGYSFPSGHTVSATEIFGTFAAWAARKRIFVLTVIFIVLIVFVGFARCFLGVHTPQDVLVAGLLGFIVLMLISRIVYLTDQHPGKDWIAALVAVVLGVAVLIIIGVKPYPMDYVNGALLVDPADMQKDCYEGVGILWGVWLGWFFERRYVGFETKGSRAAQRIVRVVIGLAFAAVIMLALDPVLKTAVGLDWAKLVSRFLVFFCGLFIVPLLAKIPFDRRKRSEEHGESE